MTCKIWGFCYSEHLKVPVGAETSCQHNSDNSAAICILTKIIVHLKSSHYFNKIRLHLKFFKNPTWFKFSAYPLQQCLLVQPCITTRAATTLKSFPVGSLLTSNMYIKQNLKCCVTLTQILYKMSSLVTRIGSPVGGQTLVEGYSKYPR